MTTVALVVPSFRRPAQLRRCLAAATAQRHPFDEIVVAARRGDEATTSTAAAAGVRAVAVDDPGVLAAMIAAVESTSSDLIAFTDDDAELPVDWSEQVLTLFDAPVHGRVGGIGGRDVLFDGDSPRSTELTKDVGRVTWWGRLVGNHHSGAPGSRPVDVLKGVNSAYRRAALELPEGLRGDGAQAHFEVAVGHQLIKNGWTLLYVGELTVAHRPADRVGEDQRTAPTEGAVYDSAYNLMRSLAPAKQLRRWLYVHAVGDRATPGALRCLVALVQADRVTLTRRGPSWRATTDAWHERSTPLSFRRFRPPAR